MPLTQLRRAYPDLSATQRRIADFVLEQTAEAAFASARTIAERTGASAASVVRLAQAVGYPGYPEFQAAVQQELTERLKRTTRLYKTMEEQDDGNLLIHSLQADIAALEAALQGIDPAVFEEVAHLLAHARRTYIMGLGISAAVVEVLAFRLRRLRIDVHAITTGGSDLLEPMLNMEAGDAVVVIAFRRVRPELVEAVQFARAREATVVAFAETVTGAHAVRAHHVLLTARGPADRLNSVAVPVAVANALGLAVSRHRQDESAQAYAWLDAFGQRLEEERQDSPAD